jgi:hypothetical protein
MFGYEHRSLIHPTPPLPRPSGSRRVVSFLPRKLVRWHQRLGHVGFLLRSGVLSHTKHLRRLHATAARLRSEGCPLCAACQFSKQRRRPLPSKRTHVIKETADGLRRNHLFPGQKVSLDHFICSTRGRLLKQRERKQRERNIPEAASLWIMQVATSTLKYVGRFKFKSNWRGSRLLNVEDLVSQNGHRTGHSGTDGKLRGLVCSSREKMM